MGMRVYIGTTSGLLEQTDSKRRGDSVSEGMFGGHQGAENPDGGIYARRGWRSNTASWTTTPAFTTLLAGDPIFAGYSGEGEHRFRRCSGPL